MIEKLTGIYFRLAGGVHDPCVSCMFKQWEGLKLDRHGGPALSLPTVYNCNTPLDPGDPAAKASRSGIDPYFSRWS